MFDLSGKNLPSYLTEEAIAEFIGAAFTEDVGDGDHSSYADVHTWTLRRRLSSQNTS